jgi:hypothetical protein
MGAFQRDPETVSASAVMPAAILSLGALILFNLAELRYRIAPGAPAFFLDAVLSLAGIAVRRLRLSERLKEMRPEDDPPGHERKSCAGW